MGLGNSVELDFYQITQEYTFNNMKFYSLRTCPLFAPFMKISFALHVSSIVKSSFQCFSFNFSFNLVLSNSCQFILSSGLWLCCLYRLDLCSFENILLLVKKIYEKQGSWKRTRLKQKKRTRLVSGDTWLKRKYWRWRKYWSISMSAGLS